MTAHGSGTPAEKGNSVPASGALAVGKLGRSVVSRAVSGPVMRISFEFRLRYVSCPQNPPGEMYWNFKSTYFWEVHRSG